MRLGLAAAHTLICLRVPAASSKNFAKDKSDTRDGGCAIIGSRNLRVGKFLPSEDRSSASEPIKISLSIDVIAGFWNAACRSATLQIPCAHSCRARGEHRWAGEGCGWKILGMLCGRGRGGTLGDTGFKAMFGTKKMLRATQKLSTMQTTHDSEEEHE